MISDLPALNMFLDNASCLGGSASKKSADTSQEKSEGWTWLRCHCPNERLANKDFSRKAIRSSTADGDGHGKLLDSPFQSRTS